MTICVGRALVVCLAATISACTHNPSALKAPKPISIPDGLAFSIYSAELAETRFINVLVPMVNGERLESPMPVLYMLDGGAHEDFLDIAGLVRTLVSNGGMRPFMLVGIENTQRQRDLTGPTTNPDDLRISPFAGGSGTFRRFLRNELMPAVRARYKTTDESAVIGKSLAGLFVLETLVAERDLFQTYIAIDPSLWWNKSQLIASVRERGALGDGRTPCRVFVVCSDEPGVSDLADDFLSSLPSGRRTGIPSHFYSLTGETDATIYLPAALQALRDSFDPKPNVER
jgi:uncharacterized protein